MNDLALALIMKGKGTGARGACVQILFSLFSCVTLCRLPTVSGLQQFPLLHGDNNDAGKD